MGFILNSNNLIKDYWSRMTPTKWSSQRIDKLNVELKEQLNKRYWTNWLNAIGPLYWTNVLSGTKYLEGHLKLFGTGERKEVNRNWGGSSRKIRVIRLKRKEKCYEKEHYLQVMCGANFKAWVSWDDGKYLELKTEVEDNVRRHLERC